MKTIGTQNNYSSTHPSIRAILSNKLINKLYIEYFILFIFGLSHRFAFVEIDRPTANGIDIALKL